MLNEMPESRLAAGDLPPVTVHNENGLDVVVVRGPCFGATGGFIRSY